MQPGEFFDVSRVREGIEALTRLFGSIGYVDFVATPETDVNDWLQRISLVMRLDEQKQFRVGSVAILGLDSSVEARFRSKIRVGEVFDSQAAYDFFKGIQGLLPPYASFNDLEVRRNVRTSIVDLVFDLRPCPPM